MANTTEQAYTGWPDRLYLIGSDGKVLFTVNYGTRALELAKGKSAIEVGSMPELVDALTSVRAAAEAGRRSRAAPADPQ